MRDNQVKDIAAAHNVKCLESGGTVLYDCKDVIRANGGTAPITYQGFLGVLEKLPEPPLPMNAPSTLPILTDSDLPRKLLPDTGSSGVFSTIAGPLGGYEVPDISEFCFDMLEKDHYSPHRGGESVALEKLQKYMSLKQKVVTVS